MQLSRIKSLVNSLKLPVVKKTVNIIEGVHPSVFKGIGIDFEELSLYQPGDNIKDIDWKASARSQTPVVKRYLADANTNMIFVIDSGKELVTRATSGERKIDVVHSICSVFSHIASKRLDAVGVIAGDSGRIMNERAKLNFSDIYIMLKKIEKMTNALSPVRNLLKVLSYCNQFLTKRSFIVLVFDEVNSFHVTDQFISSVRRLKERHDIFCVSIRSINPFKDKLPDTRGKIIDINEYYYIPAYFRNQKIANITKKNIISQRKLLIDGLNKIGVPHINVSGTEDFINKLKKISLRKEVAKL